MHPAFSVIFFTVLSGAGFGLFALIYLADLFKLGGGIPGAHVFWTGVLSIVMVGVGLLSSTLHLANPRNAWRAFSRWRTSWLSREGVLSVAFYPFALAYLALYWLDWWPAVRHFSGAIATLIAWMTIFSTAMIYASLKTIRQWNTPLVPAAYLSLGHFSGGMILLVVAMRAQVDVLPYVLMSLFQLFVAAFVKMIYFYWITRMGVGSTINTATGFSRAQVRLLDAGHTHGTFLTQEFGYQVPRLRAASLRALSMLLAFGFPVVLLGLALQQANLALVMAALVSVFSGLIAERWLFFAEARHVVNLFHGARHC
jgi:sulfite dehydrogenase (quinone) subunit SoeC